MVERPTDKGASAGQATVLDLHRFPAFFFTSTPTRHDLDAKWNNARSEAQRTTTPQHAAASLIR